MKLAKHLGVDSLGFMLGGRNVSNYIQDMNTCIQYALSNRRVMMEILEDCIWEFCMGRFQHENMINKDHNHAERTSEGILHRKGATDAKAGNMGVIPGNMSVGSCIVKGLGNEKSLKSCSHGAGRAMSRSKAKENLNIEDFECSMEGVTANVSQRTIDESPMAYKEFSQVMLDQEGLCEVVHNLRPIINWKE